MPYPYTKDDVAPTRSASDGPLAISDEERETVAVEWNANHERIAAQKIVDQRESKIKAEMDKVRRQEAVDALTARGEI